MIKKFIGLFLIFFAVSAYPDSWGRELHEAVGDVYVAHSPSNAYPMGAEDNDRTSYRFTSPKTCHLDSAAVHMFMANDIGTEPYWALGICKDSSAYPYQGWYGSADTLQGTDLNTWYIFTCTTTLYEDSCYHLVAQITNDGTDYFTLSAGESLYTTWAGQTDDTLFTLLWNETYSTWVDIGEKMPVFVLYTDSGTFSTIDQNLNRNWDKIEVCTPLSGYEVRYWEKVVMPADTTMMVHTVRVVYHPYKLPISGNPHGNLALHVLDSSLDTLAGCDSIWGQAGPEDTLFWIGEPFDGNDTITLEAEATYYVEISSTNDDPAADHWCQIDSLPYASKHLTWGDSTCFLKKRYWNGSSWETTDYKNKDLILRFLGTIGAAEQKTIVVN